MTELRIIILLIGAIVLWLIYYFGTKKPKNEENTSFPNLEPSIDLDIEKPRPNDLPRKSIGKNIDKSIDSLEQDKSNQIKGEKIITLFLHAKDGQQFDWHLIQSAAEQVGLEFGKDNLYYRFNGFGENRQLMFMTANMLKPGVFQPDMRTTGLVLIMTLPGVLPALDMWDTMFPVGERIAKILGGKLTDENHNIFSRQRIASMREEMREFDHNHSV